MDPKFIPSENEERIYKQWESNGLFTASVNPNKKPFTIILPPPNANADLHSGHAMYLYEDVMIRYKRLSGFETLWVPGADHAGFETQFVYEKHLQKEGKSRFDFPRDELFKNIWDFVMKNKSMMENQLRRLGFALDWSKEKFTLDKDIVAIVYKTFGALHKEGLIYRANRLINYCTYNGTSFSDLEVVDKQMDGVLYTLEYPIKEGGSIKIATTRPETLLGDSAVMVNPNDKRYKDLIGKTVLLPIVNREIPIIADEYVDKKFGTGAVKVTPHHDFNDFEVGKRHNLPGYTIIGFDGKIQNTSTKYDGMKVLPAREEIIKDLEEAKILISQKKHAMVARACYKCGRVLEPLPREQWFVKVQPLAQEAIKLIDEKKVVFHPTRFKKRATDWLQNFRDWNISRQVVWGMRIPAWQCKDCQEWIITDGTTPSKCQKCQSANIEQDPDTFDTWFSSGQWPYATLQSFGDEYFKYFYPTSVMETGYDILPWWVVRMIMLGKFATGKEPFQNVYLHGMVRDKFGQKMSKSKGNVINPLLMVDKYGADALRAALLYGTKAGSDLSLSEEKVVGMRNFGNKVWNIGRFIHMNRPENLQSARPNTAQLRVGDVLLKELDKEFKDLKKKYIRSMDTYKFSQALELVYQFIWHRFADHYVEQLKEELQSGNIEVLGKLENVYSENLKLLHPFMPFVTEAVWQKFYGEDKFILKETL